MQNLAFALSLFALALSASEQTFTAKVVGVHDGDTITVYDGREQTRIRLEGIDCPETGADFSTRAKQLTSGLVFGKQVRIEGKETDRYGRLVAPGYLSYCQISFSPLNTKKPQPCSDSCHSHCSISYAFSEGVSYLTTLGGTPQRWSKVVKLKNAKTAEIYKGGHILSL